MGLLSREVTCQHSGDVVGTVLQENESLKAQVQKEKAGGKQLRGSSCGRGER